MPLKFRLKGLAETFVDHLECPRCGHDGGDEGDEKFRTDLSRVTYEGIIVVINCEVCGHLFVPDDQRMGILDRSKLRSAVERDSVQTGQPICPSMESVKLDVEKINAERRNRVH